MVIEKGSKRRRWSKKRGDALWRFRTKATIKQRKKGYLGADNCKRRERRGQEVDGEKGRMDPDYIPCTRK